MSLQMQNGLIQSMTVNGHTYEFRREAEFAGPVFHVVYAGKERIGSAMKAEADGWYSLHIWGVGLYQRVTETEDGIQVEVRMKNNSSQAFRPDRISLCLGIDTYMDHYPEWNEKVFPTLLRAEKTHLWGYLRSPSGRILGIACPEAITSWALEYNNFFADCGHRVETVRLDLLSMYKQPKRHCAESLILPGEEKRWSITLFDAQSVTAVLKRCASLCHAPMFQADKLILQNGEDAIIHIFSQERPEVPGCAVQPIGEDTWRCILPSKHEAGYRRITATASGRESELIAYWRDNWSFYLKAARKAALDFPQKATSNCESWYGLFSGLLAARYLPDDALDSRIVRQFEKLLPLLFDIETGTPTCIPNRIQNTAVAVSLCEDAYQATKQLKWVEIGARLANHLIDNCQNEQGAFVNRRIHYTCVAYIAKSILELWHVEKELPGDSWRQRAEKHFTAAKRAIDELVLNRDNIGTEGEMTFEDGMISCSITQIGMMALLLPENERAPYIEAAEALLAKHRCLERMGSVDARSRNTTIRFWEAQYDVLIPANMINSPHGWSGWKVYGTWYLYLLTGKPSYLTDTMETLGSCMQLIDSDGTLRWAFVPDPCIISGQWRPNANGQGYLERGVFGETYIDMISGWYRSDDTQPVFGYLGEYPGFETDRGGCCDNDVHECFKALAEVALPYAYLYEEHGTLHAINGTFTETEDEIMFTPAESVVEAIHVNLSEERNVSVQFASGSKREAIRFGWIRA